MCHKCDTYTWRKAKHIHKRQTNFPVREELHKDYDSKGSVANISGRKFQGVWCQDELICSKPLVIR
jgi:hypothetical protein